LAAGASVQLLDLRKTYGDVVALDALSLDIKQGEFVTLLGPSGSGKTTSLMIVAGFEEPTAGDVRVGGETVTNRPPHRRNIGVVFQSYALFPHMTVAANVAYPLRMRAVRRDEQRRRVAAALELVQLGGYGERHPTSSFSACSSQGPPP
jgi:putative spermidine/putrescine transport system ATP-binding protein